MLIMAALTREVQDASADTAEAVISTALATAAEQSMDAAMFSAASGDDVRPPGLLNGTSAVPSAGKTGAEGANRLTEPAAASRPELRTQSPLFRG